MSGRKAPTTKCCLLVHVGARRNGAAHVCTQLHRHELSTESALSTTNMVRLASAHHGLAVCHPSIFAGGRTDTARYGDLAGLYVCRRGWKYLYEAGRSVPKEKTAAAVAPASDSRHKQCTCDCGCRKRFKKKRDGADGKKRANGGNGRVCKACDASYARAQAKLKRATEEKAGGTGACKKQCASAAKVKESALPDQKCCARERREYLAQNTRRASMSTVRHARVQP